jgi:hypothetical protein
MVSCASVLAELAVINKTSKIMAYCKVTLLGKADSCLVVQERKASKAVCLPCLSF